MAMSEQEYVDRIRRSIDVSDRLRYYFIAFYAMLLIVIVVLMISADDLARQLGAGAGQGFPIGVSLGFGIGASLIGILHGLMIWVIGAGRCQRLLVHFYDLHHDLRSSFDSRATNLV